MKLERGLIDFQRILNLYFLGVIDIVVRVVVGLDI